jgi:hypothetical protein
MNFFEQQLRRLAAACDGVSNPVFAGRACFGDLGADNRVKLQFVTLGHADHYVAVKATVLNRAEGEVDTLLFRFRDAWGEKKYSNNRSGVPYIWTYNGEDDWYGYKPTDQDFRVLAGQLGGYLDVFAVRAPAREKAKVPHGERESVVKKLRGAKQGRVPHNPVAAKKDNEPEL